MSRKSARDKQRSPLRVREVKKGRESVEGRGEVFYRFVSASANFPLTWGWDWNERRPALVFLGPWEGGKNIMRVKGITMRRGIGLEIGVMVE